MQKLKKIMAFVLIIALLCGVCVLPSASAAQSDDTVGETVLSAAAFEEADGMIVSFRAGVSDQKIEKTIEGEEAQVESISEIGGMKLVAVTADDDAAQTATALAQKRAVEAVQPNYRYTFTQDDPYIYNALFSQYQFELTNAFAAWEALESGAHGKTRVAVVDTGVELAHEDLQANVLAEEGSYTRFHLGDMEDAKKDSDKEDGHGTHVSGIIGATYGNNKGGAGIAAGHHNDLVEVLAVGASNDGNSLYSIDIIKAIDFAVNNGARVVNMSFGSNARDLLIEKVILEAYYQKGVVFVAAGGNENGDSYSTPSFLKEVISVNACNRQKKAAYHAFAGTQKDITAPGVQVMSTLPGSGYGTLSGTSMATPIVSAIAALVLDANPQLTPVQVYNILCATAKLPTSVGRMFDNSFGFGIVDAAAAVEAAKAVSADTPVESVLLKGTAITVEQNNPFGAECVMYPATALTDPVWSVEDSSIAAIDPLSGMIIGRKAGRTTLRVSAGGKTAEQVLNVKASVALEDIVVTGIPESGEMAVDEVIIPEKKPIPENASFRDIYILSSDDSVITATDGVLIAKKPGKATIIVESWDGAVQKRFEMQVKTEPVKLQFTRTREWVSLDERFRFEAKAFDANGGEDVIDSQIEYSSSNEAVFKVDKKSGVVTPLKTGAGYIKAYNARSGITISKALTVIKGGYTGADYGLKQSVTTKNIIGLRWNKIPYATGYQIDYKLKPSDPWKKLTTVGGTVTSYRQSKLKPGTVRYYRIKAFYEKDGVKKAYAYSHWVDGKTLPDYKLKQSAKTKNSVTLKWSKQPSAAGYQIQYRASKSAAWKTIKTVGAKTVSLKHKGLKANKTVYYRIRAYYKVAGTTRYLGYSPIFSAKTAKK